MFQSCSSKYTVQHGLSWHRGWQRGSPIFRICLMQQLAKGFCSLSKTSNWDLNVHRAVLRCYQKASSCFPSCCTSLLYNKFTEKCWVSREIFVFFLVGWAFCIHKALNWAGDRSRWVMVKGDPEEVESCHEFWWHEVSP